MRARLLEKREKQTAISMPLVASGTTIGRAAGNHIQLPEPTVSKRHAVVHHENGTWVIEDLGSSNGVHVNGEKVKRVTLTHGDAVTIGPHELVFEENYADPQWASDKIVDLSSGALDQTLGPVPPRDGA